jgi:hypothetical protein
MANVSPRVFAVRSLTNLTPVASLRALEHDRHAQVSPEFASLLRSSGIRVKDAPLALTHVTVGDCTGSAAQPSSTVVIAIGRITAAGASDVV